MATWQSYTETITEEHVYEIIVLDMQDENQQRILIKVCPNIQAFLSFLKGNLPKHKIKELYFANCFL